MLQTHSFMGVPACACFLYVHTTRNYIFLTCMHARVLITRLRWLTVLFKLSDRFQLCLLTPLFLNFSHHHNNASYNSYTDTAGGGGEGGREALSLCVHVQYCYWYHTILFNHGFYFSITGLRWHGLDAYLYEVQHWCAPTAVPAM